MGKNEVCRTFALRTLTVAGATYRYFDVTAIEHARRLPVSLKILLENVIRRASTDEEARDAAVSIVAAGLQGRQGEEIEFMPARVLFQDFTGVPVFVDFAAMRDAAVGLDADPTCINPQIPCTLVVDHSVSADVVSCAEAARENARIEAERNAERFAFLKWSARSFKNVRIVPPGVGICHQLNIERFCDVAFCGEPDDCGVRDIYFDTLVGTDSHTPTANGMGVLGWGVGGIEAEAAALGQPISMLLPAVVGLRLGGAPRDGVTAMDIALTFAERLRSAGVVGELVECFGEGVDSLSATQRATISNMSPEYGCTATLFPADDTTLEQLRLTGRDEKHIELVRAYLSAQGVFGASGDDTVYERVIEIDLSAIEPSLAGPSRPHNRVGISGLRKRFRSVLAEHGRSVEGFKTTVAMGEDAFALSHGALAIAAVTSCTTATDPAMMVAAGLVARRAVELGCTALPYVKKVFAPGSHATTEILSRAGLLEPLADLGFSVCGWGCMSCIGNSGPLFEPMHAIAQDCELTSILSGNRNFDGRISSDVAQNYLASPALVVAYSLAGTLDADLSLEPVCMGASGPVWLQDLLPHEAEVRRVLESVLHKDVFSDTTDRLFEGDRSWQELRAGSGTTFSWGPSSTYVRNPPYFEAMDDSKQVSVQGARALAVLGDFVTTDHISPAGAIASDSPAAAYLRAHGIAERDFNTYGSRRGNHEVMMRGCFANVKLENRLAGGRVGGWTYDHWRREVVSIFDASCSAAKQGVPLVVLAGKMYGSGSSRDWAAKAPALLGVRAVLAESFERIHRSNLVGMGIVPLQFMEGESVDTLGLTGHEVFDIATFDLTDGLASPRCVRVVATAPDGTQTHFEALVRVDTPTEGSYLAAGGILPFVVRSLAEDNAAL